LKENKLWNWFSLSYAGWLTIPRSLCHEMSLEWQNKLAELLKEYDETYINMPDIGTRVMFTKNGKFSKGPKWMSNYRRPNEKEIDNLKTYDSDR